ncbi:hypothetical protein QCA50_014853 [Cerrena zonata]|uniref:Uncharacterized protein n=1 Tax=Cerrena zonata TaxID=2478898 RepID=A0AAW0FMH0_9APHY
MEVENKDERFCLNYIVFSRYLYIDCKSVSVAQTNCLLLARCMSIGVRSSTLATTHFSLLTLPTNNVSAVNQSIVHPYPIYRSQKVTPNCQTTTIAGFLTRLRKYLHLFLTSCGTSPVSQPFAAAALFLENKN